ncbi:MAG: DUF309 domain-containing protein [Bacillaceae bacterium]|nr:DUF309 domain-containing protein [Bacillaceae bacterium]
MYPLPYLEYLIHFHCFRDYFECHEVLEEYWKERDKKEIVWVGFIQLAVGMYHYRRKNVQGAIKQLSNAKTILSRKDLNLVDFGLHKDKLLQILTNVIRNIENGVPYSSIHLPIESDALIQQCEHLSLQKGIKWNEEVECKDSFIIHKHILRDRSKIIEQRLFELNKRKE